MANKRLLRQQFLYSLVPGAVLYSGQITIVAGTPVTATSAIKGAPTVTRTDTGDFTVTLDKKGYKLISLWGLHQPASGACLFVLPATADSDVKAGSVKFTLQTETGTATDPTATDKVHLFFIVGESTAS